MGIVAMISIRKHIDTYKDSLAESALSGWRSSLLAIANCTERAVPGLGQELNEKLVTAREVLDHRVTFELLCKTSADVEQELAGWADRAWAHHAGSVQAMREIIAFVASAGESVVRRDQSYAQEIGDLSGRLQAVEQMTSLPAIRSTVLESTRTLRSCVEKMAAESRESLRLLSAQVAEYRNRLDEAERVAATDPLTQLPNRRAFERNLLNRIAAGQNFSLILFDLDGFKAINDRHGHLAGDDLLRQFAAELRSQFRPADLVARWGGDEFAGIIGMSIEEAATRVRQIRKWALGEYRISTAGGREQVDLQASIGLAEWNGVETGAELLARVDKSLYDSKATRESLAGSRRESDRAVAKR